MTSVGVVLPVLAVVAGVVGGLAAGWLLGRRRSGLGRHRPEGSGPARRGDDRARTLSVLSHVRRPMALVDRSLRVVAVSADAESIGLRPGEELSQPSLRAAATAALATTDGRPPTSRDEIDVGLISPVTVPVEVRASRLEDGNVLLDVEDRSEAVRVETIRRDFVVNVSHELKTPVGAISVLAETMTEAADDPEAVRRFSARMQKECARLTSLVSDIIELSRVQAVEGPRRREPVRLDDVAREAVEQVRPLATASGIQLFLGAPVPTVVTGDRELLLTAARNLLVNAVTYSPDGTRVSCAVRRREGRVDLVVTDRGIGIPLRDQERVFERFYRVDPARSRVTGGTGLGLSIVKHIAESHRGDITLWSRPGQGSTFTLRLPEAAVPTPAGGPQ